jgi:hypothetical protein
MAVVMIGVDPHKASHTAERRWGRSSAPPGRAAGKVRRL